MQKPIPPASPSTVPSGEAPSNEHPFIIREFGAPHARNIRQKLERIPIIKIGIALTFFAHSRP